MMYQECYMSGKKTTCCLNLKLKDISKNYSALHQLPMKI